MSNFIQITPFMHVEDLERALTFFNDILGFATQWRMANYAYVHRETTGFRILEQKGPDEAPPGNRRFAYYIAPDGNLIAFGQAIDAEKIETRT